jgi:hypothetical protein
MFIFSSSFRLLAIDKMKYHEYEKLEKEINEYLVKKNKY